MSVLPAFDQRMEILYGSIWFDTFITRPSSIPWKHHYREVGFSKSFLPGIYLHRLVSFADLQIWFYHFRRIIRTHVFVFQCIFTKSHKIALRHSVTKTFISYRNLRTYLFLHMEIANLQLFLMNEKMTKERLLFKNKIQWNLRVNYFRMRNRFNKEKKKICDNKKKILVSGNVMI